MRLRFRTLTFGAATGTVLLAATSGVAWCVPGSSAVVRWLTGMQLESALCLLLVAASLVALLAERRRLSSGLAIAALAIAVATLVERLGAPVGLRLLFTAVSRADRHSDLMSLSLAASVASASLSAALLNRSTSYSGLSVLAAATPLILGGLALFDQTVGPPLPVGWEHSIQMATHTATACVLLSFALLNECWHRSRLHDRTLPVWVPVSVFCLSTVITVAFAEALHEREITIRREHATAAAESLRDAIAFELTNRADASEQMAARMASGRLLLSEWQSDAELNVRHSRDPYAVVLWLDAGLRPIAAAPQQSVALPSTESILRLRALRDAVQEVMVTASTSLSRSFDIAPGVLGFAIVAPVHARGGTNGFVVTEFAYEQILTRILNRSSSFVRVATQGTPLVTHGELTPGAEVVQVVLDVAGGTLNLEVGPSRDSELLQGSSLSSGMLLVGLVLSAAAGLSMFLLRRVEIQRTAIAGTNGQLQHEVNQRRRTEEQLRQTSLLQRAVLDGTNYAVVSTDTAGVIRSVNRAAEGLFGYEAAELIGIATPSVFHADAPRFETVAPRPGEGGVDRAEWRCVNRRGQELLVEISISPLVDEGGAISGFVFTGVDVTERARLARLRHAAEESLRRTEELLHSVLDASLNGVLAFSAIRNPDGEMVDLLCQLANPAAARLIRRPEDSLVGRTHREITGRDETTFQAYRQVIESGQPTEVEHLSAAFDNRWFRIVAAPLGRDGIAATFEDITRRKEMDAELEQYIHDVEASRDQIHQQSVTLQWQAEELTRARDEAVAGGQQLERALKMQSDFVSFASHQLRTPLSGMRWLLELAQEEPGQTDELKSYITDSLLSAERLIGLVNDLLDVSRLEAGRVATAEVPVDLAVCARTAASELQPNIARAGHTLTIVGPEKGVSTLADPQLIRQVVVNLLSNSVKYTPPGGQITLEVTANETEVCCAVQDNGLGVPEASRARLFEKFFRAENVTTIETEGTGLGLYMVRLILQRFGGRIWFEPAAGGGSRFAIALPRAASGEADGLAA